MGYVMCDDWETMGCVMNGKCVMIGKYGMIMGCVMNVMMGCVMNVMMGCVMIGKDDGMCNGLLDWKMDSWWSDEWTNES